MVIKKNFLKMMGMIKNFSINFEIFQENFEIFEAMLLILLGKF